MAVIDSITWSASVFFSVNHFHLTLVSACNAGAYSMGIRESTRVISAAVRKYETWVEMVDS